MAIVDTDLSDLHISLSKQEICLELAQPEDGREAVVVSMGLASET